MTAACPLTSGEANDRGGAEDVESVYEWDADVDFGGLTVGVAGSDAFAEGLEAAHFRFDAAAGGYPVHRFQKARP